MFFLHKTTPARLQHTESQSRDAATTCFYESKYVSMYADIRMSRCFGVWVLLLSNFLIRQSLHARSALVCDPKLGQWCLVAMLEAFLLRMAFSLSGKRARSCCKSSTWYRNCFFTKWAYVNSPSPCSM